MTPERWREIRTVFDRMSDLDPGDRERWLGRECAGDAELAEEVRSLLASSAVAGEFLEVPAVEQIHRTDPEPEAPPPARIGNWDIEREVGHGGMGAVYLGVRDESGFRLRAAVKLVRRGMDSDFILRRFRTEREILSGLDHPNIARLLDGGSTADGRPYFAMEYVEGRHLLEECAARGADARQRIALFLQVCDAVAYAHRHLVVHRDLKPSNILVTPDGSPKLLDFGLARLLQPDAGGGEHTETGFRLLTPDYASPEQVRGERITTSTDIYSLGVVLYHLLAGRGPYRTTDRHSAEAIARAVCDQEPERPGVSRDLDNIVLKALRKEPERRYESVGRLADDLKRYLEGRPVMARKDTLGYRAARFIGRHKAGTAAAAIGALALAGAMGAALYQARVARAERAAAEARFSDVRQLTDSFLFEFHDAIRDLPGSTPARELVVKRALQYLEKLSSIKGGDAGLQRELATAYERVASVQGGMYETHVGDTGGARQSLAHALAIRRELAASTPATRNDREALAQTELQLAQVEIVAGEGDAAEARSRRAVSMYAALVAEEPSSRLMRARLARARRYLATSMRRTRRDEAVAILQESAAAFEALAAEDPATPGYTREVSITHQQLLEALAGTPARAEAEESYGKSVAILEALVAKEPANVSYRRELAYTHVSMATFLDWNGEPGPALVTYRRAVPLLESLVEADPRNADARLLLAETYNSIGYARAISKDPDGAMTDLRRSLAMFQSIAAADPANARAILGRARLYESFGTARAAVGDASEAQDWFRKSQAEYRALASRGPLDPQAARELEAVSAKVRTTTVVNAN